MVNDKAEAFKLEGNELVRTGKYAEALKKYKKATDIDPSCAVYWSNMAFCHDKLGAMLAFKEAAQNCVEADPSFIKGYYRLAKAQGQLLQTKDQLTTIERGLEVDPNNLDLIRLGNDVMDAIKNRQCQEEIFTASADDEDLPFLGGLPPGGICKIPQDTAFARLERPPFPPQSRKLKKKLDYCLDEKVKYALELFSSGDLQVKWCIEPGAFHLEAYLPGDTSPTLFLDAAQHMTTVTDNQPISLRFGMDPFYRQIITREQKELLQITLAHRFLRTKGALLNSSMVYWMVNSLAGMCQQRNLYKESIDLWLTCADILCNQSFDKIAYAVVNLAQALETAKRLEDAAALFLELAERVFQSHPVYPENKTRTFAAIALQGAEDFVSAEREFVGALRAAGRNWLSDDVSRNILSNLIHLYEIVQYAVQLGKLPAQDYFEMQWSGFLLVGLVSLAGIHYQESALFSNPRNCQSVLKRQYRQSAHAASRAVIIATMTHNMEDYRRVLLSCRDENQNGITLPKFRPARPGDQDVLKALKKTVRGEAKDSAKKNGAVFGGSCDSCMKTTLEPQPCPCMTARYCSKECQLAHWPQHKKFCSHRKKK